MVVLYSEIHRCFKMAALMVLFWFIPAAIMSLSAQTPLGAAADSSKVGESPFLQKIEVLDFKNVDIRDVIRTLATQYRLNIFVENDVSKRLTLHLVDVTVADALAFIVADNDLEMKQFGNIYKIMNPAPPPPEPHDWQISYQDELLSAAFENDNLQDAMAEISRETGATILVDRNARGDISGILNKLPLESGLRHLLKTNGYLLRKEGAVFHIQQDTRESDGRSKRSGNFWIDVQNQKINIEVSNADLSRVLDEISRKLSVNFFLLGQIKGTVDARANGLTLEECLQYLLMEKEYTFKKQGEVYLIGDKNNKSLSSSRLIRMNHLKIDGVIEMLPARLLQKAELKIVKSHNALLVNGASDVISEIEKVLTSLDRPIPQIFFEVLVVDYNTSDRRELSLEVGEHRQSSSDSSSGILENITAFMPSVDLLRTGKDINGALKDISGRLSGVNIGRLPDDFYIRLQALESKGKANIRLKPQISTLNGHEAELKIGETRYFKLISETPLRDPGQVLLQTTERFQTIEINISLKITPWVSASGEITVDIQPEFNSPSSEQNDAEGIPPNIRSRSLKSTVRLRDGETIVLGGLIQETDEESLLRLPILGRIPLLGRLFSSRNYNKGKSELIIYVTPHLSYNDQWMVP